MDMQTVPGYAIWKDGDGRHLPWRWAVVNWPDKGATGQSHGGASTEELAVVAAERHKVANEVKA